MHSLFELHRFLPQERIEAVGRTSVFATKRQRLANGFSVIPFVVGCVAAYTLCFAVFTKCLEFMPLGLAYGIWGGLGTVGTIIIGMVVWHEPFSLLMGLGVICVIAGTALMSIGEEEAARAQLEQNA